jgi:glutathione peroxidase
MDDVNSLRLSERHATKREKTKQYMTQQRMMMIVTMMIIVLQGICSAKSMTSLVSHRYSSARTRPVTRSALALSWTTITTLWLLLSSSSSSSSSSRSRINRSSVVVVHANYNAESSGSDDDEVDSVLNCEGWAKAGECTKNPNFMLHHCAADCAALNVEHQQFLQEIANLSFYDLHSHDIDGTVVDFNEFRNKVVIITNVASYCGYTQSHYQGLVELWSKVSSNSNNIEILAFPCNQFGKQEPGSPSAIKKFAHDKGVQFRMMEKINVNGPQTNLVYKFLKGKAGPMDIHWNFGTYYVVDTNGNVQAFNGVEPMFLQEIALNLLMGQEL